MSFYAQSNVSSPVFLRVGATRNGLPLSPSSLEVFEQAERLASPSALFGYDRGQGTLFKAANRAGTALGHPNADKQRLPFKSGGLGGRVTALTFAHVSWLQLCMFIILNGRARGKRNGSVRNGPQFPRQGGKGQHGCQGA